MKRHQLRFMIDPEQLTQLCYVPDPIRIRVTRPDDIFITGLLGESGRRMMQRGLCFYFTRKLAERLIRMKVAVREEK